MPKSRIKDAETKRNSPKWRLYFYNFMQQLKQMRDKLKQYQKKINVQLEKDRQLAKQLLQDGKKEWAEAVEE